MVLFVLGHDNHDCIVCGVSVTINGIYVMIVIVLLFLAMTTVLLIFSSFFLRERTLMGISSACSSRTVKADLQYDVGASVT